MRKLPWVIGIVVVVIVSYFALPAAYKALRGGDDSTATAITTVEADAAVGDLDGTWTVVPGLDPNNTVAGYTVDEILNGEPVTVVGATEQVSGEAEITGTTLTSATFEARTGGLATDNTARDRAARSSAILDAERFPLATLALSEPADLADVPSDGTTGTVPMTVDLTIRDVTVTETIDVTVLRSGDDVIASGAVPVTWADVGIEPPSLGFVTVEAEGTVDFRVVLEQQ